MKTKHAEAMLDLCQRFFAATSSGDLDAVRAMYAPDAMTWHNHDGVEQTVEQTLRVAALPHVLKDFRYEDARRSATATGFVEQHTVCGRTRSGFDLAIAACVVCTVVDGRITRLDEYLDSAQIAPLLAG